MHIQFPPSKVLILFFSLSGIHVVAQEDSTDAESEEIDEMLLGLDQTFVPLNQSLSVSGANATYARGIEAVFQNPAIIGGDVREPSLPFVRQVHFPYAGASINANSYDLYSSMSISTENEDEDIAKAAFAAMNGQRQYGRVAISPNIIVGRATIVPMLDQQIIAVPIDENADNIFIQGRTSIGFGLGGGFVDSKDRLYLGVFYAPMTIAEISGTTTYDEISDPVERLTVLGNMSKSYSGARTFLGAMWKAPRGADLRVAVVARDLTNSRFASSDGASVIEFKEDIVLSVGYHPQLTKEWFFNSGLQFDELSRQEVAISKKVKTGIEFGYGNRHRPLFALRTGASMQGVSLGLESNFSLFHLAIASFPVEVGTTNNRLSERRYSASLAIELVEL